MPSKAILACLAGAFAACQTFAALDTLNLRPGGEGKDAVVFSRGDAVAGNYGSSTLFQAMNWTWNADGLGEGTFRGLIEFDLSGLPKAATLVSAKLFLFADTLNGSKGHSSLSTSNASYLERVAEAWAESTVTWENQPETDTAGRITLEESTDPNQAYIVDVTDMVQAMLEDSLGNRGFLLRTIAETRYNAMAFASSDHADENLHPKLEIAYELAAVGMDARRGIAAGESPRFGISAGELILSRKADGRILDLQGRALIRFAGKSAIGLSGLKPGAYILETPAGPVFFALP